MIRFPEDTWTTIVQEVTECVQRKKKCTKKTMKGLFDYVRHSMSVYAANIIVRHDDDDDGKTISLGEWMMKEWELDLISEDIQMMTRPDFAIMGTEYPDESETEYPDEEETPR
jgi:hypothetical protein